MGVRRMMEMARRGTMPRRVDRMLETGMGSPIGSAMVRVRMGMIRGVYVKNRQGEPCSVRYEPRCELVMGNDVCWLSSLGDRYSVVISSDSETRRCVYFSESRLTHRNHVLCYISPSPSLALFWSFQTASCLALRKCWMTYLLAKLKADQHIRITGI